MLRPEQRPDIFRKKQAFSSHIRRQYLQDYFTTQRAQLQHPHHQHQHLTQQLDELLQDLPRTAVPLVDHLSDNFSSAAEVLLTQIDLFCSKMVGLDLVEWSHMVHIINRLLVSTNHPGQIQKIISHSLLPVLECSELLATANPDPLTLHSLLEHTLQYCYRLGGFVRRVNQLEENAIIATLRRLWGWHWEKEQEVQLLTVLLNILNARFEEDDIENVTPSEMNSLEVFKKQVLVQLFFRGEEAVEKLLRRACVLAFEGEEEVEEGEEREGKEGDGELLEVYLRMLVTATFQLDSPAYYYPLIKYHMLYPISAIFCLQPHPKANPLILATRLLNNMLVNDLKLTLQVLQDLPLSPVIATYHRQHHHPEVQAEIIDLFTNLLHFMNDDDETVRGMVNLGVAEVVLGAFQLSGEHMSEDSLMQVSSVLIIMHAHHPYQITKLLLSQGQTLRETIDAHPLCADQLEYLLQQTTPNEERERHL